MSIELKTALAFEERKQSAILGWTLRDKTFCGQCDRAVKQEWFASAYVGKLFAATMFLYNKYSRVPTPSEVNDYRPFQQEDGKVQEKLKEALVNALKQTEIYSLDLLRDEMTHWMHSTIFFQAMNRARDLYNASKPTEAWQVVEDAHLLRSTSSFEDGLTQGFAPSSERLINEKEYRLEDGKHVLPYGISFLDEVLGGISQSDVIVLGAKTGAGKSQAAVCITLHNASLIKENENKKVHYFALEAEDFEIERRAKYTMVSRAYYADEFRNRSEIPVNYRNWRMGRLNDVMFKYEEEIQPKLDNVLKNVETLYRNSGDFNLKALEKNLLKVVTNSKLIVLDHLHYVDTGDDENGEYKQIIKTIRDIALKYKVPIIVIAHLRKNQVFKNPPIVNSLEDFHGTSNVPKIATVAIMLAAKPFRRPKDADESLNGVAGFGKASVGKTPQYMSPTFVCVRKYRLDGEATRYTALMDFNKRYGTYEKPYQLGRLVSADTEWLPLKQEEWPDWAKSVVISSEDDPQGTD